MKLIALLSILLCAATFAAPGEPLATNMITLGWDDTPDDQLVESFQLYFRTNFPPGMPHTNSAPGRTMDWTPTDTNGWSLLLVIPAPANSCVITNLPGNSAVFLVMTSSNRLGESPFSNVAWRVAPPSSRDNHFQIRGLN